MIQNPNQSPNNNVFSFSSQHQPPQRCGATSIWILGCSFAFLLFAPLQIGVAITARVRESNAMEAAYAAVADGASDGELDLEAAAPAPAPEQPRSVINRRMIDTLRELDEPGSHALLSQVVGSFLESADDGLARIAQALAEGYAETRPLDPAMIPVFTLMRCCASVGWTMPRLAPDDPIHRSHIARAVGLARRVTAGGGL